MEKSENTTEVQPLMNAEKAKEMWVESNLETFSEKPNELAGKYYDMWVALEEQKQATREAEAKIPRVEIGIASHAEVNGGRSDGRVAPVWINSKGTMLVVRVAVRNLLENGGEPEVYECKAFRTKKGGFSSALCRDGYQRGFVDGLSNAGGQPTAEQRDRAGRNDIIVRGPLVNRIRDFLRPENLRKAIAAEGINADKFFSDAPQAEQAPVPEAKPKTGLEG